MPEHVYLTPVPDSTSEPSAFSSRNIPSQVVVSRSTLCTLFLPFLLSVFPVKNLYAAQSLFECVGSAGLHGRPSPVLATCQNSSPETPVRHTMRVAKGKFLTVGHVCQSWR